ncbi:DUF6708 domain-containing protein [Pseudomonas chlororaphis]|uniref:DUF6708 domain-containing protein n=1 Tax=Pseudomonas chlororaphis TaxID=587753 RepID=UPI00344FAA3D
MASKNTSSSDELDLKQQRPVAGETRRFATGEAVFFSPLPVPTGPSPIDLGGSFLEVNDTFLDVGSSNINKAFQARVMIASGMLVVILCLLVLPTFVGLAGLNNPFGRSFWYYFSDLFKFGLWMSLWGGLSAAILGGYAVISTTLKKARTRPIRFNRQRREVCFFPDGSDEPVIQPWEDTVAWLSVSTGSTGVGVMSNYTFGMAIDNPKADTVHFLTQEVMTPIHGLGKWEAIRVYMEKGPQFCPGKAPYEGRHTFDKEREDMREEYQHQERSLLGVGWWYLSHFISLWRIPYWIAEWDHRYSMKALPDSIDEWSKPLPPEQWAQPSAALKEQTAKIEKAFANGQDFMSYFKADLTIPT